MWQYVHMTTQHVPQNVSPPQKAGDTFSANIITLADVLKMNLVIPHYQRPYKWSQKHVAQLISDIQAFRATGHYRLGTFILHRENQDLNSAQPSSTPELDIVDGQQRYLTFCLLLLAIFRRIDDVQDLIPQEVCDRVKTIELPQRNDNTSAKNLRKNFTYLQSEVKQWSVDEIRSFTEFFLEDCSVVLLQVGDLDTAFQLFDSQNTRGKALDPTDLLKAYHLREFSRTAPSEEEILRVVQQWEDSDSAAIRHLFAAVLFPIKCWSRSLPVPNGGFTSAHIDEFKGIRPSEHQYRWAHMAIMAKSALDGYRAETATLEQYGLLPRQEFPFQILQPVIDGELFFDMVQHYLAKAQKAGIHRSGNQAGENLDLLHPELKSLNTTLEPLRQLRGDRYIRELYDCLLMAYLDRFGWYDVNRAATVLAQYAYLLRIKLARVYTSSINNHALGKHRRIRREQGNLFSEIGQAHTPHAFLEEKNSHIASALQEKDDWNEESGPLHHLYSAFISNNSS